MFQYSIERRLHRIDAYTYTLAHASFNRPVSQLPPLGSDYAKICAEQLSGSWHSERSGIWSEFIPQEFKMPSSGFKIHLSSYYQEAEQLLTAVLPVLMKFRFAFKVLAHENILNYSNSNMAPMEAAGKFVTIYPPSLSAFCEIVEALHQNTRSFQGPRIASDRRYKDSGVVYYRYGGFRPLSRMNSFGEKEAYLALEDGSIHRDRRSSQTLPNGIQDPFATQESSDSRIVLRERYEIIRVISKSTKGSVYVARDRQNACEVIIKQARPFIMASRSYPDDGRAFLSNEFSVLMALKDTGCTPKPIELFDIDTDRFLVMEKLEGKILSHLVTEKPFNLMKGLILREDLLLFIAGFVRIARNLIQAVKTIHCAGIVIRDLAPQNILYRDDFALQLIDFESSALPGRPWILSPIGTVGIVSEDDRYRIDAAVDRKALAHILSQLIMPHLPLIAPAHQNEAFRFFIQERQLPPRILSIIDACHMDLDDALQQLDLLHPGQLPDVPWPRVARKVQPQLLAEKLGEYIKKTYDYDGAGSFPCDYRLFQTNGISLFYGLSGLLLFLHRLNPCLQDLPLFRDWKTGAESLIVNESNPSWGLGWAGVAWTAMKIDQGALARSILDKALEVRWDSVPLDYFYGLAGIGDTFLQAYERYGDEAYLNKAKSCADFLGQRLQKGLQGLFVSNVDDEVYHGLGHGAAGVARFFLRLYENTADALHLACAEQLLEFELAHAIVDPSNGGTIWTRSRSSALKWPYLQLGSVGIGLVLLKAYQATGHTRYLDEANRIARNLLGVKTKHPGLSGGMAGIALFFHRFHTVTGKHLYKREVQNMLVSLSHFIHQEQEGYAVKCVEGLRFNNDFLNGSAGIGLFLLQMCQGNDDLFS